MKEQLVDELRRAPGRMGFFEVVRLLEHALGVAVAERAAGPAAITFAHCRDLTFPTSDVAWLDVDERGVQLGTTFLGLLGTASPLAPEWTEEVLHSDEDGTLAAFYDTFHHRALALLYLAYKTHSLEGGLDLGGADVLSKRLRSLAGVDAWAAPDDEPLAPMAVLGLADHQRGQPQTMDLPSAEGLLRRLYPGWNVGLEMVPRFIPFTPDERVRLGVARHRLGADLVYGDGADDGQGLVRVRVHPPDASTYESLMPGGHEYVRLERLTRQIFAATLDVELEVFVTGKQAPVCTLGREGTRLGVDARYAAKRDASLRARVRLLQSPSAARRVFETSQGELGMSQTLGGAAPFRFNSGDPVPERT